MRPPFSGRVARPRAIEIDLLPGPAMGPLQKMGLDKIGKYPFAKGASFSGLGAAERRWLARRAPRSEESSRVDPSTVPQGALPRFSTPVAPVVSTTHVAVCHGPFGTLAGRGRWDLAGGSYGGETPRRAYRHVFAPSHPAAASPCPPRRAARHWFAMAFRGGAKSMLPNGERLRAWPP